MGEKAGLFIQKKKKMNKTPQHIEGFYVQKNLDLSW